MDELENILNDAPAEVNEQEEPAAETQAEQPRAPDGKFAPKGNDDGVMPAPEDEAKQVPIGSYKAEKEKRQALEAQIEALRREMEQRNQEPPAPPPSIWEDEQGTFHHYGQQFTQSAVQQAAYVSRLQTSELLMMQADPEFVSVKNDVYEFVGANPAVNAEVQSSPHPWQTAYNAFKTHRTMQELGATNIAELEAKLREQITAEMAQKAPVAPNLPRSLADAQSARGGGNAPPAPLSLEDILGR